MLGGGIGGASQVEAWHSQVIAWDSQVVAEDRRVNIRLHVLAGGLWSGVWAELFAVSGKTWLGNISGLWEVAECKQFQIVTDQLYTIRNKSNMFRCSSKIVGSFFLLFPLNKFMTISTVFGFNLISIIIFFINSIRFLLCWEVFRVSYGFNIIFSYVRFIYYSMLNFGFTFSPSALVSFPTFLLSFHLLIAKF